MTGLSACEMPKLPNLSFPDLPSMSSLFGEGPEALDEGDCETTPLRSLQVLNWQTAKRLDIYSRKTGISPKTMVMTANTANILRLYNATRNVWTFHAEEFFKHAAVVKIFYGGKDVTESCIEAVRIGPLKWAEIRVVPLKQGEFYFRDEKSFALGKIFSGDDARAPGHIIVR
ncbi:MAG: hypothetical protein ISR51_04085 [Rhodospirillales bacterium]|nr:hypothetical protein [Rhodospirillales bacterium]